MLIRPYYPSREPAPRKRCAGRGLLRGYFVFSLIFALRFQFDKKNSTMSKSIKTVDEQQGQKIQIAGGSYRILISGAETKGAYAMIEMSVPAGAGPPPHAHADFEEIFYVVEGELSFQSEAGHFLARKGATVVIPKGGMIHQFKNLTDAPAKLLCTVMPAGLDDMFVEFSEWISSNPGVERADVAKYMQALSEKYGQQLYSPDFFG